MRLVVFAPQAVRDIAAILLWSDEHFGPLARERYAQLIEAAIRDVAADPDRLGSRQRPKLADGARTYHLTYSRARGRGPVGPVRSPRHFLVFRLVGADRIEIGRVLHDAMELRRNLPEAYLGPDADA